MQDAALAMVERLRRVPEGSEYDVEVEMTHVTADIILRTILSELSCRDNELAEAA